MICTKIPTFNFHLTFSIPLFQPFKSMWWRIWIFSYHEEKLNAKMWKTTPYQTTWSMMTCECRIERFEGCENIREMIRAVGKRMGYDRNDGASMPSNWVSFHKNLFKRFSQLLTSIASELDYVSASITCAHYI